MLMLYVHGDTILKDMSHSYFWDIIDAMLDCPFVNCSSNWCLNCESCV